MSAALKKTTLRASPGLVTTGPLVAMTGVSNVTLHKWADEGVIPKPVGRTVGGHRRWNPRAVLSALAKHKQD